MRVLINENKICEVSNAYITYDYVAVGNNGYYEKAILSLIDFKGEKYDVEMISGLDAKSALKTLLEQGFLSVNRGAREKHD